MKKEVDYISEKTIGVNHAGSKARNDGEVILQDLGYKKIGVEITSKAKKSISYVVRNVTGALTNSLVLSLAKDRILIFQYPVSKRFIVNRFLKFIKKDNTIVYIIHDIEYLRGGEDRSVEIKALSYADVLICHNKKMAEWLISVGIPEERIVILGIFDYLLPSIPEKEAHYGNSVAYAGNLSWGTFLDKLAKTNHSFRLDLYGNGCNLTEKDNLKYYGSFHPDEIPYAINSSWGLVWNGTETDTCFGEFGEYLKYNNPHKLSLYIASGIPVIVWTQSAVADYVKENNIGFAVDSLSEIDKQIEKISEQEYQMFVSNIRPIQEKIIKGDYLTDALKKAIEKANEC